MSGNRRHFLHKSELFSVKLMGVDNNLVGFDKFGGADKLVEKKENSVIDPICLLDVYLNSFKV